MFIVRFLQQAIARTTLLFNPWSLGLFIPLQFQLPGEHTAWQPVRRSDAIIHMSIATLADTHLQLGGLEKVG